MKKFIILMGPPGSGKDTQGKRLSQHMGVPLISTGEALREEISRGTEIGRRFSDLIGRGLLVPDSDMFDFVRMLFERNDVSNGFVLNGFPRTIPQAEFLDGFLLGRNRKIELVVNLAVSDSEVVKRLSGRRTCSCCGAVYNVYYSPSSKGDLCDKCGGELVQRPDDSEASVRTRLEVYAKSTFPLVEFYKGRNLLSDVDGEGSPEEVFKNILEVVNGRD